MAADDALLRPDGAENDPYAVDASPTKKFFCNVITRDLSLDQAIADLVDNCVDGAKRLRGHAPSGAAVGIYQGLTVALSFDRTQFKIVDNCGGIDIYVARKYAFKFGRDENFGSQAGAVGQFGVGMKRSLFKMGNNFSVRTRTPTHSFSIDVEVPDWIKAKSWDFRVSNLVESANTETGTEILCTKLFDGTAAILATSFFTTRLENMIATSQQHFIRNGLSISVNGKTIISPEWQLQASQQIVPLFQSYTDPGSKHPLITRLYAGIGVASSTLAGWYIFCNGRCILASDQSNTTGWGEMPGSSGVSIPRYHGQFARFRGYAFLDSEESERLPWNTTKTDLDFDHPEYMRLKVRLIEATRAIIDFLNELDRDTDLAPEDQQLVPALDQSPLTPITRLTVPQSFRYVSSTKKGPVQRTISFKKPESEVRRLQTALGASGAKDTGEKAFEYAFSRLVEEGGL